MSRIRIVIADDERPAREFLKSLLAEISNIDLIGEAENGIDAIDLIKAKKPDLALLDLQMPGASGLEVVGSLTKNEMPLVAFVTAYDDHAVNAFEVNAVDYLLKPVEIKRLRETIARATERLEREDWRATEAEKLKNATSVYGPATPGDYVERIPVRIKEEIVLVPVGDVSSIVADGELLRITSQDNKRYTINFRLKDLEVRLDPKKFIRLSRSAVVNLESISRIAPMPGGTFLVSMKNGQELAASRIQSKVLRTNLLKI